MFSFYYNGGKTEQNEEEVALFLQKLVLKLHWPSSTLESTVADHYNTPLNFGGRPNFVLFPDSSSLTIPCSVLPFSKDCTFGLKISIIGQFHTIKKTVIAHTSAFTVRPFTSNLDYIDASHVLAGWESSLRP